MEQDKLIEIFQKHLEDNKNANQSETQLVRDVVAEYIFHLMNRGNIPHQWLETLETDLTEEVQEIYRKKTYGSYNLTEYKKKK